MVSHATILMCVKNDTVKWSKLMRTEDLTRALREYSHWAGCLGISPDEQISHGFFP